MKSKKPAILGRWKVIEMPGFDEEYGNAQEVHLTLPELNGLASCIAAQIRRTTRDRKLGVRLNRIWERIVGIEKLFEQE